MNSLIGEQISHYRIFEKLGQGGMGEVYLAEDTKLKRKVALKFLPQNLTTNRETVERFEREARATASLNHPNIITIHEVGEVDGRGFIAMEYVNGSTLREKIANGPLPFEKVTDIATQICEGLDKAHRAGITHRDIKPENILIDEDGCVKIVDFGLAKLKGATRITKESSTQGTIYYMSPEQVMGEVVDHRTDIWSVGVVLYEMLAGEVPFKAEYEQVVMAAIKTEKQKSVRKLCPDIPVELERILGKALMKNNAARYEQIEGLQLDLRRLKQKIETAEKQNLNKNIETKTNKRLFRKYVIPIAIAVLFILILFLIKPILFKKIKISEPTPIAVISFENKTGEESYDYLCDVIPNLLITNLEQSDYFQVTTWERLNDLLEQMGKNDVKFIDKDIGFELCQIEGIDAIIIGFFSKAGEMFVTDLKVLDVTTKKLLKSTSSRGEGVSSILKSQIDELTKEITKGFGIAEPTSDIAQKPVAKKTTTSMEAYTYFLRGKENYEMYYYTDAHTALQKAIELDSTFAIAYLWYAKTCPNLGLFTESRQAYKKAKFYINNASEKDQLYIKAYYASRIERDYEEASRNMEKLIKKYPNEKRIQFEFGRAYLRRELYTRALEYFNKALELDPKYGNALLLLGYTYYKMGDINKAIEYYQRYVVAYPRDADPFDSLGKLYFRIGKLNESIKQFKHALEIKPDLSSSLWSIGYVLALTENYSEALRYCDRMITDTTSLRDKQYGYLMKALYYYYVGRLNEALNKLDEAILISRKYLGGVSFLEQLRALIYYDATEYDLSRKSLSRMIDLRMEFFIKENFSDREKGRFNIIYNYWLGRIDLKEGLVDSAKSRLAEIKTIKKNMDLGISQKQTLLSAEILLTEKSYEKAIATYTEIQPAVELSFWPGVMLYYNLDPRDLLARIYKEKGDINNAIAEYERLITVDPNSKDRRLIHPRFHYEIAKLYEAKGATEKAVREYEKFLELWKNADDNLHEKIDATKRLANLMKAE